MDAIPPDVAKRLLNRDFANLVKRVQAGGKISRAERAMLQSMAVGAGAAVASLGALLALIAGIGRTTLAMARNGDLPRPLAIVHPRHRVPGRAEIGLGAIVCALVLTTDLRGAIGFSSFGVLVYYAVANAAAFTQDRGHRRWPRADGRVGQPGRARDQPRHR